MNASRALDRAGLNTDELRASLHPVNPGDLWLWPASALLRRLWTSGVSGMTLGRLILVDPALLKGDPERLGALTVHELVHVKQFGDLGVVVFGLHYLGDYLRGRLRGLNHRQAYRGIRFEVEARRVTERLTRDRSR